MIQTSEHPSRQSRLVGLQADHQGALLRYAARFVGPEQARDVVQDAFARWLATDSPPRDATAKAWLFTVTRNRALDLIRKDKRMNFTSDLQDPVTSSAPSADVLAVVNEQQGQVLTALGDLPSLQQDVLRLKFQNEFTYKQIAEITGKSASHVGVLIHDGLTALRSQFRTLDLLS